MSALFCTFIGKPVCITDRKPVKAFNMFKYLFGPVPSRRLGMSLGVDLVPAKVCSLDCVYCEVGKTTSHTLERKEYIPYDKITEELSSYFNNNPDPDYITFSGSGEPCLNIKIGDVLKFIKQNKPGVPVALLTNGTLFHDPEVRASVADADLVLPSLDAVTAEVFSKINRPAPGLTVERHIRGLIEFSREYRGRIWLEVLILPGFNDSEEELLAMKEVIKEIAPESVQLNTLDRPGTVEGLRGATRMELQRVMDLWGLENASIIAAGANRKNIRAYREDMENAILETISRRPCTVEDLISILGIHINEINKYLDVLESDGVIESVRLERGIFYRRKAS